MFGFLNDAPYRSHHGMTSKFNWGKKRLFVCFLNYKVVEIGIRKQLFCSSYEFEQQKLAVGASPPE